MNMFGVVDGVLLKIGRDGSSSLALGLFENDFVWDKCFLDDGVGICWCARSRLFERRETLLVGKLKIDRTSIF
jgi:hypothetical protein